MELMEKTILKGFIPQFCDQLQITTFKKIINDVRLCVGTSSIHVYLGEREISRDEAGGNRTSNDGSSLTSHTLALLFQITTFKKILSSCDLRLWGIDLLRHSLPFFTVSKCNSLNFLTVFIFLNHL